MNSKARRSPTISLVAAIAACSLLAGNANAQSGSKSRANTMQSRTTTPGSSSKPMMSEPMSGSRSASVSIALDGYCPVCILEIKKWVKGKSQFFVDVDNKRYLFPDEKTRAMFMKNSAKYTPALNGDCVVCYVDGKTRAPGRPAEGPAGSGPARPQERRRGRGERSRPRPRPPASSRAGR
ncbi:MAG: hypothetical protein AAF394_08705, partial [Planctomycetota bacterium]